MLVAKDAMISADNEDSSTVSKDMTMTYSKHWG